MSQLLENQRADTEQHLPRLFRNRTVDYTLLVLGAVVAAFGAYIYFAPAGFGMYGASVRDQSGHWTAGAVVSFVLGALSLAGAVTAAVLLII